MGFAFRFPKMGCAGLGLDALSCSDLTAVWCKRDDVRIPFFRGFSRIYVLGARSLRFRREFSMTDSTRVVDFFHTTIGGSTGDRLTRVWNVTALRRNGSLQGSVFGFQPSVYTYMRVWMCR